MKNEEEKTFHFLKLNCPDCLKPVTILDFLFTSEGDIKLKLLCVVCGRNLSYDTTWERLVIKAATADNKKLIVPDTFTKTLQ